ncbi:MAG TPA: SbcC/MukB-like Walker B domain-containing protein, partial [Bacillales bacterium]|nr:SbcC/MukB-like Walker B domain-containing protein [Bacillales bacterium]
TARLERRLREAREADKLAPYLAEAERAAERLNACEARVGEAERALAEAKARFARAEEAHARAKTARAEHEPRLFGRKEQLKQALRQEEEIGGVEKELAREREKASEAESVWQKQTKAIEAEERELARWLEAQKVLKREFEAIRMPYEEKTRIRKAAEAARAVASQREAVKEAEKERDEKRQAVETLQKEAEKLAQEHEKRLEQFRQAYEYVLERYNEVCEIDKLRELAMAVLRKQEAEALEAWDQQRERQLAGELAQHLHDGEPCPVCGATEHPALAAESEMEMDRSELERIRKQIETGRSMDVGSLKVRIEQIAGRIAEWLDDKQYETLTAATAEVAQNEEYLEISELNKQLQRLKETFGHWEKSRSTELRNMTALKESVTQKQSMLDSKKQEWQTADKKMQDLQSRMKTQESHWQETYSEWSLETIAEKEQQMSENEKRESSLQQRIEKSVPQIEAKSQTIEKVKTDRHQTELEKTKADHRVAELERTLKTSRAQLKEIVGDKTASELLKDVEKTLRQLAEDERTHEEQRKSAENGYVEAQKQASSAKDALIDAKKQAHDTEQQWMKYLSESAFATSEDVKEAKAEAAVQTEWERSIEQFYDEKKRLEHEARQYEEKLAGREMDEAQWQAAREAFEKAKAEQGEAREARGNAKQKLDDLQAKHETFARLDAERKETEAMLEKLNQLRTVFRGNGFVEFVAEEQLMNVSREASERLGALTRQRYGIEVDSSGGFIMRDDANGGVRRPVTTLSGGETFLTSLALALSLSAQIQLRGRYPLEFFFLDEGFGTLDQELLDTVVTALEKLRFERFSVGVISHVPELKSRLPVQLLVEPPEPSGEGSRTHLKIL